MNFIRPALAALLVFCCTSCNTLIGLMNSYPVRMLDAAGSSIMGSITENDGTGKPASIEERAREVRSRGLYVGPSAAATPPTRVAAR